MRVIGLIKGFFPIIFLLFSSSLMAEAIQWAGDVYEYKTVKVIQVNVDNNNIRFVDNLTDIEILTLPDRLVVRGRVDPSRMVMINGQKIASLEKTSFYYIEAYSDDLQIDNIYISIIEITKVRAVFINPLCMKLTNNRHS